MAKWANSGLEGLALERAYRTLVRASDFLSLHAERPSIQHGERFQARFLGNGLRELDRFLSILADAAAVCLAPPGHDERAFARLRNTPNKLRSVRAMMDLGSPDHERLRAIGRLSACLHYCTGRIHDPSLWSDLSIAAGHDHDETIFVPFPGESRLILTPVGLAELCLCYRLNADDLIDEVRRFRAISLPAAA